MRATVNQTVPAKPIPCQSVLFQALSNSTHTNTGRIYVYDANSQRVATLAVPTTNTIPFFSATVPSAPGALTPSDYYIDADNASDGVDASYITP